MMADKIKRLRDFAAGHGSRFAVVMFPVHAQVYAGFASPVVDQPQRELGAKLQAAGIPHLDLLPVLRSRVRARPQVRVFYDQCHYTPEGNGVVAEAILDFLRRERHLPTRCC